MNGFPNNFYELVQQLGRVDRKGTAQAGENRYEIHVDSTQLRVSLRVHNALQQRGQAHDIANTTSRSIENSVATRDVL